MNAKIHHYPDPIQHVADPEEHLSLEEQVARLTNEVQALTVAFNQHKGRVEDLITAWENARGALVVIKWLAIVSTALLAIKAAVTGVGSVLWEKLSGGLR